jgi:hypothetical protein
MRQRRRDVTGRRMREARGESTRTMLRRKVLLTESLLFMIKCSSWMMKRKLLSKETLVTPCPLLYTTMRERLNLREGLT